MGKNPGIIIKEQRAKAREIVRKAESAGWSTDEILKEARDKYECTCGYYKDLMQAFMLEGYTAHRAERHISEWVDNDLILVTFMKGYKIVGYGCF